MRRHALTALVLTAVLAVTASAAHAVFVSHIVDSRVKESSALAVSTRYPGYAYTLNDDEESNKAIVYAIKISTGQVVGTTILSGVKPVDPEALALDRFGKIWYADTGKDGKRDWSDEPPTLWRYTEPTTVTGEHTVTASPYVIEYPDGKHHDVETFMINAKTSEKVLITKEPDALGTRFSLPKTLSSTSPNRVVAREKLTDKVSDGAFTPNGKWAVIRSAKVAYVYSATTPWRRHASFNLPTMYKPESLSFSPNGTKFLVGSEGSSSPLYWIPFDQVRGNKPTS